MNTCILIITIQTLVWQSVQLQHQQRLWAHKDKDLWEIVEGTSTTPSDYEEAKMYDKLLRKALLLVVMNVSDQQAARLKKCNTGKKVLDKLEEVH